MHVNPTERDYSYWQETRLNSRASLNSLQLAEKISTIKLGNVHAAIKSLSPYMDLPFCDY